VAQSPLGKAVSKVASTGGGRTYRAQRPTTYYSVLALIVVLGLISVVAARQSYKHGAVTTTVAAVLPQSGTTSYAALGFDLCGTLEDPLAAAPAAISSIAVDANGVLKITPKDATTAGSKSTLALVAKGYPSLSFGATSITYPTDIKTNSSVTYKNGQACPKGTPDAGKAGQVSASVWTSFAATTPKVYANPADAHVQGGSIITVAFLPSGSKVPRPTQASVTKMLKLNAGNLGKTTTTTANTPSTSPTTTTTMAPTTTTTMAPTTTTTPSTTTTTKKS